MSAWLWPQDVAAAPQAPALRRGVCPPQVSVVMATCRRPGLLRRCLLALERQTLPAEAFEIVVVDDGPDADTQALVGTLARRADMPPLHYLRTPQGHGPAAARNAGWRAARAPVVAFTDDDTVPAVDWLERGLAALRAGGWAAIGGRIYVPLPARPSDHERTTQGLERTRFVTANAFVTRWALQQVGGFDERFTRAWREDSDLQFRLEDAAGPVGRCEDALVLHPVRHERWGVSLRQQRNAFFEALFRAKHPERYAAGAGLPVPWHYYGVVACSMAALPLWAGGRRAAGAACAAAALLLVLGFALWRLRGTSHRAGHVLEMLLTSAAIPFLSVYWRLRGALHFRVWRL